MPTARIDPRRHRVTHLTGLRINAYARARENGIRETRPIRHHTGLTPMNQHHPIPRPTTTGGTP